MTWSIIETTKQMVFITCARLSDCGINDKGRILIFNTFFPYIKVVTKKGRILFSVYQGGD